MFDSFIYFLPVNTYMTIVDHSKCTQYLNVIKLSSTDG